MSQPPQSSSPTVTEAKVVATKESSAPKRQRLEKEKGAESAFKPKTPGVSKINLRRVDKLKSKEKGLIAIVWIKDEEGGDCNDIFFAPNGKELWSILETLRLVTNNTYMATTNTDLVEYKRAQESYEEYKEAERLVMRSFLDEDYTVDDETTPQEIKAAFELFGFLSDPESSPIKFISSQELVHHGQREATLQFKGPFDFIHVYRDYW